MKLHYCEISLSGLLGDEISLILFFKNRGDEINIGEQTL